MPKHIKNQEREKCMKNVFKKFSKSKLGLMLTMAMIFAMTLCSTAFAAVTPAPLDLDPIQDAIMGSISVSQIALIIAACIGAGMGFVLLWFGARKLVRSIMSAFKKGKLQF
ncbi:MAG: hypothetical protein K0S01_2430 [Herbinix sp.]|jgi:type IV secretory pathway VirB2 component (pilin)|nr:hypothetical protein [Herbinix sp.]